MPDSILEELDIKITVMPSETRIALLSKATNQWIASLQIDNFHEMSMSERDMLTHHIIQVLRNKWLYYDYIMSNQAGIKDSFPSMFTPDDIASILDNMLESYYNERSYPFIFETVKFWDVDVKDGSMNGAFLITIKNDYGEFRLSIILHRLTDPE